MIWNINLHSDKIVEFYKPDVMCESGLVNRVKILTNK